MVTHIQLKRSGIVGEEQSFNPRDIVYFLWRRWKIIVVVTVAALLFASAWLARTVPLYTASTQVLLDPRKEKAAGSDAILSDVTLDLPTIENEIAIIKSTGLLRRVVEKEHLTDDPEFGSRPRNDAGGDPKSEPTDSGTKSRALDKIPPDVMASINALRGAVSVSRAGQGFILAITVTSANPARAARLANAIADAYIVDAFEARLEAAQRASVWLGDQLEELRHKLRKSEQAVAAYRSEHNLIQVSEDVTLNQEQIGQLNNRLVLARAETAEKKARLELLTKLQARGGSIRSLPDDVGSGLLSALYGQLADISRREADLTSRYSSRYPQVVTLRAERSEVERAIAAEVRRSVENLRNGYALAIARESALEKTLREATGQINIDNQTAITLRELQRTAAVDKGRFEDFLQRARITQEQSTFEARQARVIVPASPPGAPSSPKKGQTYTIALVLGLLLGVGAGSAIEKLNTGFTSSRQFEELVGAPILATIPRMDAKQTTIDGVSAPLARYIRLRPQSRLSESLRSLRMGVRMSDPNKEPPKVIQLTSALAKEGKTTTALMLAASAASSEQRVLLVDADLRDPAATRYFSREQDVGLTDYLLGKNEIESVIHVDDAHGLSVLPTGVSDQCPTDLLSSDRMRKLIDYCRTNFDYVLLDTPPVGPAVDALVTSSLADIIVFVIRWRATPRELVYQAVSRVSGEAKLVGGVFNFVDERLARKYGESIF